MSVQKLLSKVQVTQYDFDPGVSTLVDVAWVDMRDFNSFAAAFFRTIGTSDVVFKIIANDQANGGGTDVVLATSSADPDAVGDYCFLEVNAEQIAAAGLNYRYVSAQVSFVTDTDEGVVTYIRGNGHCKANLTADVIA